jgi:hypothetical protein
MFPYIFLEIRLPLIPGSYFWATNGCYRNILNVNKNIGMSIGSWNSGRADAFGSKLEAK